MAERAYSSSFCITMGSLAFGSSLSNIKYYGEAVAAAERIDEMIKQTPLIDSESAEGERLEEVRGEVEFKDVRFRYPTRPAAEVVKGFSLTVPAGKTVALVGESGSGKSTVITLLQRFYDPTGGEILLDGVDIRRLKLKWFRAQMGLVSQEPALFATSIKENILFGKEDATMEDVIEAAEAANAAEFISKLPLGYDTQVFFFTPIKSSYTLFLLRLIEQQWLPHRLVRGGFNYLAGKSKGSPLQEP